MTSPSRPTPGDHVLIVDADSDAAESLAILLRLRGGKARTASDVSRAIELAGRDRPGRILLHLANAEADGSAIARRLRRELPGPLLLIAMVDYSRERPAGEDVASSFDGLFVKPVDRDGLDALLAAVEAQPDGGPSTVLAAEASGEAGASSGAGPTTASDGPIDRQSGGRSTRCSCTVEVSDPFGLHLRPASAFVKLAARFASEVSVRRNGRTVNGKSMLDVATMAAACGDRLELEVSGPDADQALVALADLFSPPAKCGRLDETPSVGETPCN